MNDGNEMLKNWTRSFFYMLLAFMQKRRVGLNEDSIRR